jgi:hypothetical protein
MALSPLCLPERDLRVAFVMEIRLVGPPGRIAGRPIDRLRPPRLAFKRRPRMSETRRVKRRGMAALAITDLRNIYFT